MLVKEVPASKELAPDLETIRSEMIRFYEKESSNLKVVRRGMEQDILLSDTYTVLYQNALHQDASFLTSDVLLQKITGTRARR
jgi:hypothetical protein